MLKELRMTKILTIRMQKAHDSNLEERSSLMRQRKLLPAQAKFFKNITTVLLIFLAGCAPVAAAIEIPVDQTPTLDSSIFNIPVQVQTETPAPVAPATTDIDVLGSVQVLEGPDINYNNILFTLDPQLVHVSMSLTT